MGSCAGKSKNKKVAHNLLYTSFIKSSLCNSEQHNFRLKISNLKIRGTNLDNCFLKLRLKSHQKETNLGTYNSEQWRIEWNFSWEVNLQLTLSELPVNYLEVEVYHKAKIKLYSSLKLNLLEIAVGPVHYDVCLSSRKHKGRLIADIEMDQIAMVKVKPLKIKTFIEHLPDSHFAITLKLISNQQLEDKHSSTKETPYWDFTKDSEVPVVEFPASIADIRNSVLNLKLWILRNDQWKVAGDCWVALTKLLKEDRIFQNETEIFKERSALNDKLVNPGCLLKVVSEELWKKGRKIGNLRGRLVVSNLPFIHQMISGVYTESGLEVQSLNVINKKPFSKRVNLPIEMIEVNELVQKLKEVLEYIIINQAGFQPFENNEYENKSQWILKELSRLLVISRMDYSLSFTYISQWDLVRAQQIMLDLAEILQTYHNSLSYNLLPLSFECLTNLLRRGELDLGHLTLQSQDKGLRNEKLKVAERYRSFLYSMMGFVLPNMDSRGCDSRVYTFIELFLALAYFRIPGFRERLLRCLRRKMWMDIEEWNVLDISLESENESHELVPMLDWQSLFWKHLSESQEDSELLKLVNSLGWQETLAKRNIAYFRFVEEWALHVNRQFVRREVVPWKKVPGYTTIIKSFLLELKNRNISSYPDAMIKASCTLLLNSSLINTFIAIIFKKANIFRFQSVQECLNVMNQWFESIWSNNKGLPYNFDEDFFLKGLKTALLDEMALNNAKALWFIYRHYHLLKGKLRQKLVKEFLLRDNFGRFMFHWGQMVRKVYIFILLFRIDSLKEFNFETEGFSVLDQEIHNLANEKLHNMRCNRREPYFKLAIDEYKHIFESYTAWLGVTLKAPPCNLKFGAFNSFPYPELRIELPRDKTEGMDEW